MNTSETALQQLKELEGYHKARSDGSCEAYRCVVGKDAKGNPVYDGKWTIGYGCTEGVSDGMRWTHAEAEAALRRELAKHEAAVTKLVIVDLAQGQFDALCLFSYNVGSGALASSTLLRKLNSGDYAGAAGEFDRWTGSAGVKNVPGLVARRAAEKVLFARPDTGDNPWMPQTVVAEPVPDKLAHHEADEQLAGNDGWYGLRRLLLRTAQPGTALGFLGVSAAQLSAIRIPSLEEIERVGAFLTANGWRMSLAALVAAIILETLQAAQRAPIVNEGKA